MFSRAEEEEVKLDDKVVLSSEGGEEQNVN
jgi:hypothetical protein